jgi:hypothetical protein
LGAAIHLEHVVPDDLLDTATLRTAPGLPRLDSSALLPRGDSSVTLTASAREATDTGGYSCDQSAEPAPNVRQREDRRGEERRRGDVRTPWLLVGAQASTCNRETGRAR